MSTQYTRLPLRKCVLCMANERARSSPEVTVALDELRRNGCRIVLVEESESLPTTKCDAVVGFGGDGTVNRAAALILDNRLDCPFAIVPYGTGNDFARAWGLEPGNVATCLREVLSGRSGRIYIDQAWGCTGNFSLMVVPSSGTESISIVPFKWLRIVCMNDRPNPMPALIPAKSALSRLVEK